MKDSFGIFKGTLLKLFAISKTIISKVDYEDITVEKGEGFRGYVCLLSVKEDVSQQFIYIYKKMEIDDISNSGNDRCNMV